MKALISSSLKADRGFWVVQEMMDGEEESKLEVDPNDLVSELSSDDISNFNGSDASNNNSSASDFGGNDIDDPVSHIDHLLKNSSMLVLVLYVCLSLGWLTCLP